jgi:phosphoribosylformylglycinamidine cyclo-ligase
MSGPTRDAYRDAGVDIDAGEAVVDGIRAAVDSTRRPGVIGGIGGFGGLFALNGRFLDPVLVSGTDGVGTKLLVAQRLNRHESIGVDLVAMCVNDIVVCGAEPLFFLDYFATGRLAPEVAVEVVKGIAAGCREAGCALVGGETAEMPGMYAPGHYDLAGFAVGAVERDALLDGTQARAGDAVVGIPSSGVHSNGYSLVRMLCDPLDWAEEYGLGEPLADALLRPTRIYVRTCLQLLRDFPVHGFAHITGGGLTENIPRVLPPGLGVRLQRGSWQEPPIFGLLRQLGSLSDDEMWRTFNCGLGMVVVVPAAHAAAVATATGGTVVGEVVADPEGRVVIA